MKIFCVSQAFSKQILASVSAALPVAKTVTMLTNALTAQTILNE